MESNVKSLPISLEVKRLQEGIITGYGILFNKKDLTGDTFTTDTDYGLSRDFNGMPVYYDHTVKGYSSQIGVVKSVDIDDVGIRFDIELDKHNKYLKDIEKLLEHKALGLSTGALGHTVKRENGNVKRWIVGEISLTPTPAENKTIEGVNYKMAKEKVTVNMDAEEEEEMTEEEEGTKMGDKYEKKDAHIKALEEKIDSIMEAMNNAPANKSFSVYGGDAQPETKSLGDFLLSVYRGDTKRLNNVYKALNESSGSSGGYLVPQQFVNQLLKATNNAGVIEPLCRTFQMNGKTMDIPALKQSGSYVEGQSQFYGGVQFVNTDEYEEISSTEPTFRQITLTAHKQTGLTEITNETLSDNAVSLESILTELFANAMASRKDYLFLRGSGSGQPLGVYNSSVQLSVDLTDSAPTVTEYAEMMSNLLPASYGTAVWIVHPTLMNLIWGLDNDAVSFLPDLAGQPRMMFMGRPVKVCEHMPTTVATGGIMLADFSYYVVGNRQSIEVARSVEYKFDQDATTWRVISRFDGQPWLDNPIYVGSSTQVSPFVVSE
jgi:HK97 family phage major capsid protein